MRAEVELKQRDNQQKFQPQKKKLQKDNTKTNSEKSIQFRNEMIIA